MEWEQDRNIPTHRRAKDKSKWKMVWTGPLWGSGSRHRRREHGLDDRGLIKRLSSRKTTAIIEEEGHVNVSQNRDVGEAGESPLRRRDGRPLTSKCHKPMKKWPKERRN